MKRVIYSLYVDVPAEEHYGQSKQRNDTVAKAKITVNAFKKHGYLKEISLSGNKTLFDTNTKNHHHFYDEDVSQLIDIEDKNISINYLPKIPSGKKIKSVEVLVKIEDIK